MDDVVKRRELLKANFLQLKNVITDQQNNIPPPDLEKKPAEFLHEIKLPDFNKKDFLNKLLTETIADRRSIRKFTSTTLELRELGYLLWATQGIKEIFTLNEKPYASCRNVPSAGARHPFETYLVVLNVKDLEPGIYKYSALESKLHFLYKVKDLPKRITEATLGQSFTGKCNAVFVWSCIPYRAEWRYNISAYKGILLDAGHVCQNLYLACEEIDCGTCAIAAYDQKKMDELLQLDGTDEMVVYLSPVGKK
jgi:SagB-type dehydrogenase family enzyme